MISLFINLNTKVDFKWKKVNGNLIFKNRKLLLLVLRLKWNTILKVFQVERVNIKRKFLWHWKLRNAKSQVPIAKSIKQRYCWINRETFKKKTIPRHDCSTLACNLLTIWQTSAVYLSIFFSQLRYIISPRFKGNKQVNQGKYTWHYSYQSFSHWNAEIGSQLSDYDVNVIEIEFFTISEL